MAHVLDIRTKHAHIADVVLDLARSVDETSLVLTVGEFVEAGEWVRFAVALRDGTPVLEGVGRCEGGADNGDGSPAGARYELLLDSLQFDVRNEIMFERIKLARESILGDEPTTGLVEVGKRLQGKASTPVKSRSAPPPAPRRPSQPAPARSGQPPGPVRSSRPPASKPAARPTSEAPAPRPASRPPSSRPARGSSPPPRSAPTGASTHSGRLGAGLGPGPRIPAASAPKPVIREAHRPGAEVPSRSRLGDPDMTREFIPEKAVLEKLAQADDTQHAASTPEETRKAGGRSMPLPPDLVKRAAALAPKLEGGASTGEPLTPLAVLRVAMRVGLSALEAQYAQDAWNGSSDD